MTDGFWYLATPYSKWHGGLYDAWDRACRAAGQLIKADIPVYSPIAHSHPIAMAAEIDPLDHNIWLPAGEPMMDAARGLLVLKMLGWQESRGVQAEIVAFSHAGKPVVYLPYPLTDDAVSEMVPW